MVFFFPQMEFLEYSRRSYVPVSLTNLLETEANSWREILVENELRCVLHKCKLDDILSLLHALPEGVSAGTQFGLEPHRMAEALSAFYSSLFSPLAPQLDRLQDPQLREKLRRQTAGMLFEEYSLVNTLA